MNLTFDSLASSASRVALSRLSSIRARSAAVPSRGMLEAGYPTGASADAMYYDTTSSRTGWYALAAFLAMVPQRLGYDLNARGLMLTMALRPRMDRHRRVPRRAAAR